MEIGRGGGSMAQCAGGRPISRIVRLNHIAAETLKDLAADMQQSKAVRDVLAQSPVPTAG